MSRLMSSMPRRNVWKQVKRTIGGPDGLSHYLHHAAETLRSTDEQLADQIGS